MLGFPLALFISRAGTRKNLYLQLVMLPFWTSFLVRTYAWMFLLRDTGLINTVLQALGLIHEPLPLLYNDGAVLLDWSTGICRSWCCRSMRRWSAWTRLCSKPRPIWARAVDNASALSSRSARPAFRRRRRAGLHPLPRAPISRPICSAAARP